MRIPSINRPHKESSKRDGSSLSSRSSSAGITPDASEVLITGGDCEITGSVGTDDEIGMPEVTAGISEEEEEEGAEGLEGLEGLALADGWSAKETAGVGRGLRVT